MSKRTASTSERGGNQRWEKMIKRIELPGRKDQFETIKALSIYKTVGKPPQYQHTSKYTSPSHSTHTSPWRSTTTSASLADRGHRGRGESLLLVPLALRPVATAALLLAHRPRAAPLPDARSAAQTAWRPMSPTLRVSMVARNHLHTTGLVVTQRPAQTQDACGSMCPSQRPFAEGQARVSAQRASQGGQGDCADGQATAVLQHTRRYRRHIRHGGATRRGRPTHLGLLGER